MHRLYLLSLLLFVVGCGAPKPVRTAGTADLPPEQLALVQIRPHGALTAWRGQPIHVESFYVGEAQYLVAEDRDFYVLPGEQTFTIDYGPCVHGLAKVEEPFNTGTGVFEGPYGRFDATLEAGRAYAVAADAKLVGKNAVQTEHAFREVALPAVPK